MSLLHVLKQQFIFYLKQHAILQNMQYFLIIQLILLRSYREEQLCIIKNYDCVQPTSPRTILFAARHFSTITNLSIVHCVSEECVCVSVLTIQPAESHQEQGEVLSLSINKQGSHSWASRLIYFHHIYTSGSFFIEIRICTLLEIACKVDS